MNIKTIETNLVLVLKALLAENDFCVDDFRAFLKEKEIQINPTVAQLNESQEISTAFIGEARRFKETKKVDEASFVRGLVDGVFDMAHFGHFNAFRQASKLCDELVIAVNGDEEATKAKGSSKQIQTTLQLK